MAKIKTKYICQSCGNQAPTWIGKCPECGEWNTFVEEIIENKSVQVQTASANSSKSHPVKIAEITGQNIRRIDTANAELNRVLGGGLVPGSLVLLGGEPGIGKSTLALQIALNMQGISTLYVSGEESEQQIKLRANRLSQSTENCYILSETKLENVLFHAKNLKPNVIVIDSIQTLYTERMDSSPGSVGQIRECAAGIMEFAKQRHIPVFLIGHITKEGSLAGPKILEHIVDVVLQFEGDRNHLYRILRANKNRFGASSELGIFEMQNTGLREVSNPSELLLSQSENSLSGTAVSATVEGVRPFLIEIQALVSSAVYGTPQRSSTGFNLRRLNMLLAVLEKRAGFRLAAKDVFLNIAGGLKVEDPAVDLAVICAIFSSDHDIAIASTSCFAGEIGLSGEIRPVSRIEQRISEAQKLGFKNIYISKYNKKGLNFSKYKIAVHTAGNLEELFRVLFG